MSRGRFAAEFRSNEAESRAMVMEKERQELLENDAFLGAVINVIVAVVLYFKARLLSKIKL